MLLKAWLAYKVAKMYGLEASTTINFYRYCDMVSLWRAFREYCKLIKDEGEDENE